ncbi:MAG: hypothetical protein ACKVPX_05525 [Myxococcaceae bacterium]
MLTLKEAEALSDEVLLWRLQGVLMESRVLLADVLALLGEVDARRLYLVVGARAREACVSAEADAS